MKALWPPWCRLAGPAYDPCTELYPPFFRLGYSHNAGSCKNLVSLTSLRTLTVVGEFWEPGHLQIAFAHCTPGLEHLRVQVRGPIGNPMSTHAPASGALSPPRSMASSPRSKLSSIRLLFCPTVLCDAACVLEFSSITRLLCLRSMGPTSPHSYRAPSDPASVSPGRRDDIMGHLDLNLLPALTHIDIGGGPAAVFNRVLSRLAPANRLAAIRLLLYSEVDLKNRAEDFEYSGSVFQRNAKWR
ncbi:hypothetical protein B0H13DRAFT_226511 [Mycena leptocephala]|nr:hypothetical protein B0H13DRAFT_226511 [Mycena leptocephala]